MELSSNQFTSGLVADMHPLNTLATQLTDALNATLITFNGNEMMLLNDMGNTLIQDTKTGNIMGLRDGFIPLGMKEHGGILYIASVNKEGQGELGMIPSPIIKYDKTGELKIINLDLVTSNKIKENVTDVNTDYKIYPGEQFCVQLDLRSNNISIASATLSESFIRWKPGLLTEYAPNVHTYTFPLITQADIDSEHPGSKGLYKINLYSYTDSNIYNLASITKTRQEYAINAAQYNTSDYWFIPYTNTPYSLDDDVMRATHLFKQYPGNVPAGKLAIKAELENIESFNLIPRRDKKKLPFTWRCASGTKKNHYFVYCTGFKYINSTARKIHKLTVSCYDTNRNSYNINTHYWDANTSTIKTAINSEFIVSNSNWQLLSSIGTASDTFYHTSSLNNIVYFSSTKNGIFDSIQSETTIENSTVHYLTKELCFEKFEHTDHMSGKTSNLERYGMFYIDINTKYNNWYTIEVNYFDDYDNKIGTYTKKFNPFLMDSLGDNYETFIEETDYINQYYDIEHPDQDVAFNSILPDTFSLNLPKGEVIEDTSMYVSGTSYRTSDDVLFSVAKSSNINSYNYLYFKFRGDATNWKIQYTWKKANHNELHLICTPYVKTGFFIYPSELDCYVCDVPHTYFTYGSLTQNLYNGVDLIVNPIASNYSYIDLYEMRCLFPDKYHDVTGELNGQINIFDIQNQEIRYSLHPRIAMHCDTGLERIRSQSFPTILYHNAEYTISNAYPAPELEITFAAKDSSKTFTNLSDYQLTPLFNLKITKENADNTTTTDYAGFDKNNIIKLHTLDLNANHLTTNGSENLLYSYYHNTDCELKSISELNFTSSYYPLYGQYYLHIPVGYINTQQIGLSRGVYLFNVNCLADTLNAHIPEQIQFDIYDTITTQTTTVTISHKNHIMIPTILFIPNRSYIVQTRFLKACAIANMGLYAVDLSKTPNILEYFNTVTVPSIKDYDAQLTSTKYSDVIMPACCTYIESVASNQISGIKCIKNTYNFSTAPQYAYQINYNLNSICSNNEDGNYYKFRYVGYPTAEFQLPARFNNKTLLDFVLGTGYMKDFRKQRNTSINS